MKKIISIFLTITIIFSCINTGIYAETVEALSISAPSSAIPGETINVLVNVPNGTNALSGSFNLIYDNTMLEVVSCTAGTILSDKNVALNPTYSESKIRMSFDGEEILVQGGVLLNVAFNVLPGSTGTVKFEVEKFKLYDENYEAIDISDTFSDSMYIVNDANTEVSVICAEAVNTGDNITVLVNISNALNVCGGSFNLVYDAHKLSLVSASTGSVLSAFSRQLNKNYATNKVRLTWAGSDAMTENGTVLTLVFTAKDGVTGSADFTLEKLSVSDINGAVIESVAKSGATDVVCTHNNMEWVVTEEATCTEAGTESYMCGCGYITDNRDVTATGHVDMEWVITTEATCDNTGVREYTCKACGYVEGTEEIPAHGHIYESVITLPTQSEQGFTTHTCTGCGYSYKDAYTEATGFVISYDVNGGENAPESQNKKSGESINLSDIIPIRAGYTFLGWATDMMAENAEYYAGNTYSEDADLTLYALWDANEHTITYVVDGETVSVQVYDYEELINALPEPQKEGYTFSGWDEVPLTMPDEDITVSGSFAINSYIVAFNANGGINAPEELTDVYNSSVVIPETIPSKEGYTFVGWATSEKAKKAEYNVGDSISLTKDYTLYAVWVGIWNGGTSETFSGGAGTKTNPYIIKTAEELKLIADKVNSGDTAYASACYIMVNDIALNDVSNVDNWATEAPANEWTPIGSVTYPFTGTFDGNGYTIGGVYISKPKENNDNNKYLGVFGYGGDGSVISNITVNNSYISGYSLIGAIVGQSKGSIKNCNNYSNIYANYWASGISGLIKTNGSKISPIVENCTNYGVITTDEGFASGITTVVSIDTPIEVKNCINYGNIFGNATDGVGYGNGGIVSHANTANCNVSLENCINYGDVSGAPFMGGISGYNHINGSGQIYYKNCTNYGKVADNKGLGGITGSTSLADNLNTQNAHVIYENCYNHGEISGTVGSIGGIIGLGYTTQIKNCYNVGFINCPDASCDYGGIAGYLGRTSTVSCCYNVGKVYGNGSIGGIVGAMYNETNLIENCANYGSVSQSGNGTHTGGICGYLIEGSTINNCINIGTIADKHTVKGGIVGYNTGTVTDCYYLDTCGAAGAGTALTYTQMQSCANYSYYSSTNKNTWKNEWVMGCNPYGVYPSLKGMVNLTELPVKFELNGGNFDEYAFCASVVPSQKNVVRGTDYLVVYNNSNAATGTNNHGYEVVVDSRNVVIDLKDLDGNNIVPNGGFILSGHGMMHEWLQKNIELGDKVYYDPINEIKVYKKNPKFTFTYGYSTYLPTPHKEGYVFGGWYDENDNLILDDTKIYKTDTLRLRAKWEKVLESKSTTYNGHTYLRFDTSTAWESAKDYCESIGGHLATISTAEENAAITSLISDGEFSAYLLGGSDISKEGTFEWITGEPFSYSNWSESEPNDTFPGEDIVEIYKVNGGWNDVKNAHVSDRGFICEIDNFMPVGSCTYNGHLYQLYDDNISWEYAKTIAESKGGYLAIISDENENNAIVDMITDCNGTQSFYWLGASDVEKEGVWKWLNGETLEYSNWQTGQPDNYQSGTLSENYLHLYNDSERMGLWNDIISPHTDVGFICEYELTNEDDIKSGTYKNIFWTLKDGVLNLSGKGAIEGSASYPWDEYNEEITRIIIGDGITDIGYAFSNLTYIIENIVIPKSVTAFPENFGYGRVVNASYAGSKHDFEKLMSQDSMDFANTAISYGEYSIVYEGLTVQNVIIGETANITSDIPSKENLIFEGWTTQETDGLVEYKAGDEITPTADIVLYPLWKEAVTITYDAAGGTNAPLTQSVASGETFRISDEKPVLSGHMFSGWTDSPSDNIVKYLSGGEYAFSADTTLYAVWKEGGEGTVDNILWRVEERVLTIEGQGKMPAFSQGTAPWYEYKDKITSVIISDKITSIGNYAFYGLNNVTSAELGSVTSIGEYAFSNCSALSDVDTSNVTSLGSYAFRYCTAITEIKISSATTYGTNVYSNCSGLTSVIINDDVEKIPSGILNNCGVISSLVIPATLTAIDNEAFDETSFTTVTYEGTKEEFASLLLDENTLFFEYVVCSADDTTYTYADFFAETVGITGIAFEKKSVGLYVGDNAQMSVDITPVNATENVNWESDNVAVATVDDYGNVTALTEGIANIIAISESGAVTAKCVVYVTDIIDENEPTIYCDSINEIKNGDTFDVNISLKNNPGIASMRLTLTYDKSVMALTNVTDLGLIGEAVHSSDYTADNYTLYWDNGTATSNFADDGDIVTLTFTVNDTVKSGDYPIMITYDYNNSDIVNCELIPVKFEVVNGFVTIKSFTYGDVNDDGRVNALDSAYLSRYIAKWTGVSINLNAADVNKDGKINALDSAILKRHIARWTNYGTLPH